MELQLQPASLHSSKPLRRARTEIALEKVKGTTGSSSGWGSGAEQSTRYDREEKEKQIQKAQLMLRTWELVARKERLEKESRLKEKVALQRQLISKCEKLIEEKKMTELQRNTKKREEELARRKLLATSLVQKTIRQHSRVSVKKDRSFVETITTKKGNFSTYNSTNGSDIHEHVTEQNIENVKDTTNIDPSTPPEQALGSQTTVESKTEDKDGPLHISQQPEDDKYINIEPLLKRPENRIAKFIGLETGEDVVKMDELWNGLKVHGRNQLKPLRRYVKHLKSISGPSTKECMEEYEKPLPIDTYSGKPVLLMNVLANKRRSNPPDSYYIVKHNRTIAGDKSTLGQKLVERMKSASNIDNENNSNWFTLSSRRPGPLRRPVSAPVALTYTVPTPNSPPALNLEDIEGISFLTDEGKIIGSSKNKSHSIDSRSIKAGQSTASECVNKDSNKRGSTSDSQWSSGSSESRPDKSISNSRSSSSGLMWQPLSLSALNDYRGVKQRVLSGHGKFHHGDTKLWKQPF